MKKAFKWLEANDLAFEFYDYRKEGITEKMVRGFVEKLGLDLVLNKRGTTWRKLPDDVKETIDEAATITLLTQNEAMIKRPIFDLGGQWAIGFSKKEQAILEELLLG